MFLWCHVRPLNSYRINKKDKKVASTLDYSGINFSISKKDYCKIEKKKVFVSMFFHMIMGLFIQSTYLVKNLVIVWIYC